MELKIGDKALSVSFLRVTIGKEFDVANRLSTRFSKAIELTSYYTCYGNYDLVEFVIADSYEMIHNVPFDRDIIDCEISLFYSWEKLSYPIDEWTKGLPVLVFVLLEIQPNLVNRLTFSIESEVLNFIKCSFGDNANLFASIGRSEILLLLRGNNFETLLKKVSELRQFTTVSDILQNTFDIQCNPQCPIFIDSTTFPLIIHPFLKRTLEYDALEGNVLPMVNVVCNPGFEKIIARFKLPSCAAVLNYYGNYDGTMIWKTPVPLSQFAKELTEFRKNVETIGGIRRTGTTFLGTQEIEVECHKEIKEEQFKKEIVPNTDEIIRKSVKLNPTIRSQLREFLGRLNSYYMQPESKASLDDMTGIYLPIIGGLNQLETIAAHQIHRINNYISEIIDLCNNGLFQRYAGLETRFEECKNLPLPLLRGINGFIAAASCIPCFIFKAFTPSLPIKQAWPGFVIFGLSYSYQVFDGRILSYPAASLQKPIEDWWGITHEVAHSIYGSIDFYNEKLDPKLRRFLKDGAPNQSELFVQVEEIYSHWFDFKYIFSEDRNRYFPMIWRSWLRWPRIWQRRDVYVLRSFIIFVSSDLKGWSAAESEGHDETQQYMESKYREMINLINESEPEFFELARTISTEKMSDIIRVTLWIRPFLEFLQKRVFDTELYRRLNPPYSKELIDEHVTFLENGTIITGHIPNPIKLLHELYYRYEGSNKTVPLKITAATVLTLWSKYMKEFR